MSDDKVKMPVAAIELQECLFAGSLYTISRNDIDSLHRHIRETFRMHRFSVINWLMLNGVSIPSELLSDQTHPQVGAQYPDKKDRV